MVPNPCVLIVDDEPNVRLMLRTALESVGYDVTEAEDGHAALDRLGGMSSRPDLILLDLKMPRSDGMEVLRGLRAMGNIVPVVILTAHGSIPDVVLAMKLGAIDFLAKPITPEALRRVVSEVIARHAREPATAERPLAAPAPDDRSPQVSFALARAKRALNRGEFSEADRLLRDVIARDPDSTDARELLDRLLDLKEQEGRGSFRILQDWFPSGTSRRN
jgi:DNA-binding response OmpR family regulator